MSRFIKKEKAAPAGAAPAEAKPLPGDFCLSHPALWEYMSEDRFPDGSVRETATLTVFTDQASLKACLNDRANSRVAFVSGRSLAAVLDALEGQLQADSVEWRAAKKWTGKGKR